MMPEGKQFKQEVRRRMALTGENYVTARRKLLEEKEQNGQASNQQR